MLKGKFITLEGGEASGKSTHLQLLGEWLTRQNIPHIITHEPGGTPLAEDIRHLLLKKQAEIVAPDTELLLAFASRAQHLAELIVPALNEGKWVVCSRFTDSTYAYQGAGRGLSMDKIAILETLVHGHLQPDVTFLLDLPVTLAATRARERGELDRIEEESLAFFDRVHAAYLIRAKNDPERFCVIDASAEKESVHQQMVLRLSGL